MNLHPKGGDALETHRERHAFLHAALDELVADYVRHTGCGLVKSSIMQLMLWSAEQTRDPTPEDT